MNKLLKRVYLTLFAIILMPTYSSAIQAQETDGAAPTQIPAEEKNVTSHSIKIDGETIEYDATAATKLIYDAEGKPIASWGYISYTRSNGADAADRPVTFVFNGGPGSSSIWLHMGAVGPKRVVLDDPNFNDSGYTLADNEYSILDDTDIVMVDPVGTGITRAVGDKKNTDFWGVEEDISSISNFINAWINEYDRWASPKYLLGESYGTFRAAGLAPYLQNTYGIALDGIVLVSNVLDLRTITFGPEDDTSYILFLPAYAATAWYHEKVQDRPEDLESFVEQARTFAYGPYTSALMKGDELNESERNRILNGLVRFTGLDRDYLERSNLRVTASAFFKELLSKENMYVGRLDSRYKGYSMDPLAKDALYDPQSVAISPPYQMAFMDYYHGELGFGKDMKYNFSAYSLPGFNWNWTRNEQAGWFPTSPTTVQDLREAMIINPGMKVMVQNGYYDLATPFSGTEYTFDHMNLPEELKDNIELTYYEAGHMFYINMPDMQKFKEDIVRFISTD